MNKIDTNVPASAVRETAPDRSCLQKSIVITQQQGAQWLIFLGQFDRSGKASSALLRFRDTLADACWLGRWTRSYVTIDLGIEELPAVIIELAQQSEADLRVSDQSVREDMLRTLSAG